MIEKIFYELINEAWGRKVTIDGEEYPVAFNTVIYRDDKVVRKFNELNNGTLVIKNEEEFFHLLKEYLVVEKTLKRRITKFYGSNADNDTDKLLMMYLFVNSSTEELLNPCEMLRRRISFLQDDNFEYLDDGKSVDLTDTIRVGMKREKMGIAMETPYKMSFRFETTNGVDDVYSDIAYISYGIYDDGEKKTCYVYSIMTPKGKKEVSVEEAKLAKKMNRLMYKLNDGVMEQESDDFLAYKNGEVSDYYPENISDVTHNFVFALTGFITLLQNEGITRIKVVPYLPFRYESREMAAEMVKDGFRREELFNRNIRIQENATNKFVRTFRRVQYHLGSSMEVLGLPYEIDEFLSYKLSEQEEQINNPLLEKLSLSISDMNKGKKL